MGCDLRERHPLCPGAEDRQQSCQLIWDKDNKIIVEWEILCQHYLTDGLLSPLITLEISFWNRSAMA